MNFADGLAPVVVGGRTGYVDQKGRFVVNPQYEWAGEFHESRAAFMTAERKLGFIDRKGSVVSEAKFLGVSDFSDGLAAVKTEAGWGFIDPTGTMVVEAQFDTADAFQNGLAHVTVLGKEAYVTTAGDFVLDPFPGTTVKEMKERMAVARALLERADALHDHGDDAGALEAYMEAVKADSNGANLDTISRYAPFQYFVFAPPPPPPGKQPSDEQAVAKISALQLAALRQYLQLRPNDWEATKALLPLVDLAEGQSLLDPVFKSRPRDPEPYAVRAALLSHHHRFAAAADDRAKVAALDPQNPESYYGAGVAAYEAVAKEATLTADQKRTLIRLGLAALERGETLKADYFESMVYRVLLLRQKALLEVDPAAQKTLTAEADEIRQRAVEIVRRRREPNSYAPRSASELPAVAERKRGNYNGTQGDTPIAMGVPLTAGTEADTSVPWPRPETQTKASYTEVGRKAGIKGTVIVRCSVSEDGDVVATEVVKALPFGLDAAAVAAVRTWKFRPALKNGKPIAATYDAVVDFH